MRETRAGGRVSVGRLVVVLAALLAAASSVRAASPSVELEPQPQVAVHERDGLLSVSAQFHIREAASVALAVLTDYEQIPRFMPDVTTSVVRQRRPGAIVVEQEAVARMLMFSRRIHLLLNVQVEGDTVTFHDASGRSFTCYEGTWRLTRAPGYTVVTYQLTARPSFEVPRFLMSRILKRDARRMIACLRTEIAARARLADRQ